MGTHYESPSGAMCGAGAGECTMHIIGDRTAVTCKRCLASLAKRDREFQRKARRHVVMGHGRSFTDEQRLAVFVAGRSTWRDAARAIAREEGRL